MDQRLILLAVVCASLFHDNGPVAEAQQSLQWRLTSGSDGILVDENVFPKSGVIFDGLNVTDVMDITGQCVNAASIKQSVYLLCKKTEGITDSLRGILQLSSEADYIFDFISFVCTQVDTDEDVEGIEDACLDLVDATGSIGSEITISDRKRRGASSARSESSPWQFSSSVPDYSNPSSSWSSIDRSSTSESASSTRGSSSSIDSSSRRGSSSSMDSSSSRGSSSSIDSSSTRGSSSNNDRSSSSSSSSVPLNSNPSSSWSSNDGSSTRGSSSSMDSSSRRGSSSSIDSSSTRGSSSNNDRSSSSSSSSVPFYSNPSSSWSSIDRSSTRGSSSSIDSSSRRGSSSTMGSSSTRGSSSSIDSSSTRGSSLSFDSSSTRGSSSNNDRSSSSSSSSVPFNSNPSSSWSSNDGSSTHGSSSSIDSSSTGGSSSSMDSSSSRGSSTSIDSSSTRGSSSSIDSSSTRGSSSSIDSSSRRGSSSNNDRSSFSSSSSVPFYSNPSSSWSSIDGSSTRGSSSSIDSSSTRGSSSSIGSSSTRGSSSSIDSSSTRGSSSSIDSSSTRGSSSNNDRSSSSSSSSVSFNSNPSSSWSSNDGSSTRGSSSSIYSSSNGGSSSSMDSSSSRGSSSSIDSSSTRGSSSSIDSSSKRGSSSNNDRSSSSSSSSVPFYSNPSSSWSSIDGSSTRGSSSSIDSSSTRGSSSSIGSSSTRGSSSSIDSSSTRGSSSSIDSSSTRGSSSNNDRSSSSSSSSVSFNSNPSSSWSSNDGSSTRGSSSSIDSSSTRGSSSSIDSSSRRGSSSSNDRSSSSISSSVSFNSNPSSSWSSIDRSSTRGSSSSIDSSSTRGSSSSMDSSSSRGSSSNNGRSSSSSSSSVPFNSNPSSSWSSIDKSSTRGSSSSIDSSSSRGSSSNNGRSSSSSSSSVPFNSNPSSSWSSIDRSSTRGSSSSIDSSSTRGSSSSIDSSSRRGSSSSIDSSSTRGSSSSMDSSSRRGSSSSIDSSSTRGSSSSMDSSSTRGSSSSNGRSSSSISSSVPFYSNPSSSWSSIDRSSTRGSSSSIDSSSTRGSSSSMGSSSTRGSSSSIDSSSTRGSSSSLDSSSTRGSSSSNRRSSSSISSSVPFYSNPSSSWSSIDRSSTRGSSSSMDSSSRRGSSSSIDSSSTRGSSSSMDSSSTRGFSSSNGRSSSSISSSVPFYSNPSSSWSSIDRSSTRGSSSSMDSSSRRGSSSSIDSSSNRGSSSSIDSSSTRESSFSMVSSSTHGSSSGMDSSSGSSSGIDSSSTHESSSNTNRDSSSFGSSSSQDSASSVGSSSSRIDSSSSDSSSSVPESSSFDWGDYWGDYWSQEEVQEEFRQYQRVLVNNMLQNSLHQSHFPYYWAHETCNFIEDHVSDRPEDVAIPFLRRGMVGTFQVLALNVKGSVCNNESSFSSDGWFNIYNEYNPYFQFNEMLARALLAMSRHDTQEDLCRSIPHEYEGEDDSSLVHEEYSETILDIVGMFFAVLENTNECQRVIGKMFEEHDADELSDATGFESVQDLCGFITDAYAGRMDLEDLNMIVDATISANELSSDTYSSFGANGTFWWETPSIDFKSWFAVLGMALDSDTLRDGVAVTCQHIGNGVDMMTNFDFHGLCDAIESRNLNEFIRTCKDDLSPSWYYDYEYWDDYWENWNDWWQSHHLYNYHHTIVTNMLREAIYQSNIPVWNPFESCVLIEDNLQANMDFIIDNYYRAAAAGAFRWLSSHVRHSICPEWESRGWSWSSMAWLEEDKFLNFEDTIGRIVMSMGGHESEQDLCDSIPEEGYWDEDQDGWLENDHITNVVETFFTMLDDSDECENILTIFENAGTINFYNTTGFRNTEDLCDFVVRAFQGAANLGDLNIADLVSHESSSYVSESVSVKTWDIIGPERPGWITPYVDLKSLLAVFGTTYNDETLSDALVTVCDNLRTPIGKMLGQEAAFDNLCSAYLEEDDTDTQVACEHVLVPLIYGPDYPVNLRPLDWESLLMVIPDVLGITNPQPEVQDICPVAEDLLNTDINVYDIAYEIADQMMLKLADWMVGFCESKEEIYAFLTSGGDTQSQTSDALSSRSRREDNFQDDPFFNSQYLPQLDALAGFVSGLGSIDGICESVLAARYGDGADDMLDFVQVVRDNAMSLVTNAERCKRLMGADNIWWDIFRSDDASELGMDNVLSTIYWYGGFEDETDLCDALVYYMTQEEIVVCFGIVDCAGVCNGDASEDCAGICNGGTQYDCAGDCGGDAFTNDCDECVGGRTGRAADFGADQCGNCRQDDNYLEHWDCFGTCYGNATIDKCSECVGGDTGKSFEHNEERMDCRGICDGGWVEDTCEFCEPPSETVYPQGSKYKDCSSTCVTPGFPRAYENDCGECVGGNTGHDDTYGINVCGQCESDPEADETSCHGCDGVPNSGLEFDACGVCGGDGTDCVGVSRVNPNLIPDAQQVEVGLVGAGFREDSELTCLFTSRSDGSVTEGEVLQRLSYQEITCLAQLEEGEYDVGVRRDSDLPTDILAPLKVYTNLQIASFEPFEITMNTTLVGTAINITATASEGFSFAAIRALDPDTWDVNPVLLADVSSGDRWKIPGQFLSDNELLFPVEYQRDSGRLDVKPTINGHSPLVLENDPTYLTVYYQAPEVVYAKFTPEGAGLQVHFDLGIDYEDFDTCDDVFADVSTLGDGAECRWQSPRDMSIVIGRGDNLIEIGDSLEIAEDTLYAFRQDFARPASGLVSVAGPDETLQPEALISGSPKLPSCGDVELNGRRSTGGGGRSMTFEWSVASDGDTSSVTALLDDLNSENAGMGVPDVSLDGDNLDADTAYTFTLTVSNFLGGSDSAPFSVERSGMAAPEVKVVPNGIDPKSVKVADSFTLTAEVKFYSECVPAGDTVFEWSCNNTDVPLNLKTQYSRTLYVDANSLPGGVDIQFTVKVYKSSDVDAYVEQSLVVNTVKSDLVAIIKGGTEFTVGRDGGKIAIDGSLTYDPDEEARPWEFAWECIQTIDNSACWSFDPDHLGELLIDESNINGAVLKFDPLGFEADKSYEITLIAKKQERSASATVYVDAVDGNPPKVEMSKLQDDGKVKDTDVIFMRAYVYSTAEVTDITWATVDTEDGYGFIDLSNSWNLRLSPRILDSGGFGFVIAMIGIAGGVAERGTSYAILINATTADGQWGTAKAYITVRSGPTSCDFSVEDYEEFSATQVLTENCVTEADAQPLSFQLFTEKSGRRKKVEAVTEQKSEPSFEIVGKPASNYYRGTRTYTIKVCNKFDICSEYDDTVTVRKKESFTESEKLEYKSQRVNAPKFKRDYQKALGNLNLVAKVPTTSRKRRVAAETTSETATEQLELITLTIEQTVLTISSSQLLIDNTGEIEISELSLEDQMVLLGHYLTIIAVFNDAEETIPESSSDLILEKVGEISEGLDSTHNENILDRCKAVQEKLLGSLTSDLVLGGGVSEVVDTDVTLGIQRTLLDNSFDSKTNGTAASIDFGSELNALYGAAWTCSTGETCSGVTLKISHYNTDVDTYSRTDDDKNNRAADIIEIILNDPESDEQLNVTDLTTPVRILFPLTISLTSMDYTCTYWDSTNSTWSTSGIATNDYGNGTVECATSHLSVFTVIGVPIPTTELPTTSALLTTTSEVTEPHEDAGAHESSTPEIIIEPNPSSGSSDSSVGIIMGIIVAVVVIVIGTLAAIYVYFKKHNKHFKQVTPSRPGSSMSTAGLIRPGSSMATTHQPIMVEPREDTTLSIEDISRPCSRSAWTPTPRLIVVTPREDSEVLQPSEESGVSRSRSSLASSHPGYSLSTSLNSRPGSSTSAAHSAQELSLHMDSGASGSEPSLSNSRSGSSMSHSSQYSPVPIMGSSPRPPSREAWNESASDYQPALITARQSHAPASPTYMSPSVPTNNTGQPQYGAAGIQAGYAMSRPANEVPVPQMRYAGNYHTSNFNPFNVNTTTPTAPVENNMHPFAAEDAPFTRPTGARPKGAGEANAYARYVAAVTARVNEENSAPSDMPSVE